MVDKSHDEDAIRQLREALEKVTLGEWKHYPGSHGVYSVGVNGKDTPLRARPLDDDGAIEFQRVRSSTPESLKARVEALQTLTVHDEGGTVDKYLRKSDVLALLASPGEPSAETPTVRVRDREATCAWDCQRPDGHTGDCSREPLAAQPSAEADRQRIRRWRDRLLRWCALPNDDKECEGVIEMVCDIADEMDAALASSRSGEAPSEPGEP